MRIEYVKFITRKMVQVQRTKIFLFGDNWQRKGFGGQAREMRGEPNVVGIPTKKAPSNETWAFLTDDGYDANVHAINEAFKLLEAKCREINAEAIVIPKDGIGTGLARLDETAPRTFAYLERRLKGLRFLDGKELNRMPTVCPECGGDIDDGYGLMGGGGPGIYVYCKDCSWMEKYHDEQVEDSQDGQAQCESSSDRPDDNDCIQEKVMQEPENEVVDNAPQSGENTESAEPTQEQGSSDQGSGEQAPEADKADGGDDQAESSEESSDESETADADGADESEDPPAADAGESDHGDGDDQ